jgi:YbgC/YbaW family acyl-CoA thioester hydrolase
MHKTSLEVRSYECDALDHVNNAVYLNYLEYARIEFLGSIDFDYKALLKEGYGLVVAEITIKYKRPAFLHDQLEIRTYGLRRRKTSGTLKQEIYRGEDLIAEAEVIWVSIGPDGRPSDLPKRWSLDGLNPED